MRKCPTQPKIPDLLPKEGDKPEEYLRDEYLYDEEREVLISDIRIELLVEVVGVVFWIAFYNLVVAVPYVGDEFGEDFGWDVFGAVDFESSHDDHWYECYVYKEAYKNTKKLILLFNW